MSKILTIVIPCYNCEKTLEEAVVSCYQQELTIPYEIILVDDGSTDNTRKIMGDVCQKYSKIKCIYHEKNMGGGATRNSGIKNSTGEYIFCLDSDDILPKGTLKKMTRFIDEKRCDGVAIHKSIKFRGSDINDIEYVGVSPFLEEEIDLEKILSKKKEFVPVYVNFLYTRNAFNKTGGYPTTHGYDTQGFAWRFLCAGLSVYTCPDSEYLQRIHFNESYFVREYNGGKMNYNWREIFLEHHYVFNEETLHFICSFDCQDFTKSILDELINRDNILKLNYRDYFGKKRPVLSHNFIEPTYVRRNSARGYYFRAKHRLKVISKKIQSIKIGLAIQKLYRYSYSILTSPFVKRVSKADFNKIYSETKLLYLNDIKKYNYSDDVLPQWQANMLNIERYFLDSFSFSFLNYAVVKNTMFMYTFKRWKNIQKSLISKYFSRSQAREILREYNIGKPLLNDLEYITSGNNIHHLYHLVKFFKETKTNASDHNMVVEVGGGYGNMAKIYKKLNIKSTYVIIDIPIFSYIQALYLKTIHGRDSVHIVNNDNLTIRKGLINIVPLDKKILTSLGDVLVNVDLFISTWALSESNSAMQNYIKEQDYFKAKYLLLAYQKSVPIFAFAENTKNVTKAYHNIFNEKTEYVEDSYYLMCKRHLK